MKPDDILKLAREQGLLPYENVLPELPQQKFIDYLELKDSIIAFSRAIADLQKEKDAKICEQVSKERRENGNHIGFNAICQCAENIRSPESDLDEALRRR